MLEEFVGHQIVVDLQAPYVCLGTLKAFDNHYLDLRHADLHDLRDTDTSRELYVADSKRTGIKRNRKRLLLVRAEVLAVTLLDDVVDE
jgi:hypothetical protein